MYSSVLALFSRALRVDVRSRGSHLARLGLVVAIYLSVLQVQMMALWGGVGAPGLSFFRSILWLNLIVLTLVGIGAFSSTITEEKEEDSLGLLRMAGVDSLGLLLGKTGGRLIQALALVIVQYPFTLLSITFGGVAIAQIQAAYFALAAYVLLLAGLGSLCSTISQTSRGSARLLVLAVTFHGIAAGLCAAWDFELARTGRTSLLQPLANLLSTSCVFLQTGEILTTGFASSVWTVQVVSNGAVGLLCFLLSWALFDVCSRSPHTEPMSRGFLTTGLGGFRWFNPGRPWTNPLAWKDYHFAAGGIAGLMIRAACYLGLFAVIYWFSPPGTALKDMCRVFLAIQLAALPFDASLLISRALQDEVRGQTIPALVMLPRSVPSIVYSKLGGALRGLIPGLACLVIAFAGSDLLSEWIDPSNWRQYSYVVFFLPNLLLLPHLTAVIALVARWGATPLAIVGLYVVQSAEGMLFMPLFLLTGAFSMELYLVLMGTTNVALCVACHFEVMRRFRKLADK